MPPTRSSTWRPERCGSAAAPTISSRPRRRSGRLGCRRWKRSGWRWASSCAGPQAATLWPDLELGLDSMRLVIVGCGRVGAMAAVALSKAGHQVTVVDVNRRAFDRLGSDFTGEMILGNGIDEDVLRQAGIESADGFASMTNGDNRNIMAAQIAREMFKVPRLICRISVSMRVDGYSALVLDTSCRTITVAIESSAMQ